LINIKQTKFICEPPFCFFYDEISLFNVKKCVCVLYNHKQAIHRVKRRGALSSGLLEIKSWPVSGLP